MIRSAIVALAISSSSVSAMSWEQCIQELSLAIESATEVSAPLVGLALDVSEAGQSEAVAAALEEFEDDAGALVDALADYCESLR